MGDQYYSGQRAFHSGNRREAVVVGDSLRSEGSLDSVVGDFQEGLYVFSVLQFFRRLVRGVVEIFLMELST